MQARLKAQNNNTRFPYSYSQTMCVIYDALIDQTLEHLRRAYRSDVQHDPV